MSTACSFAAAAAGCLCWSAVYFQKNMSRTYLLPSRVYAGVYNCFSVASAAHLVGGMPLKKFILFFWQSLRSMSALREVGSWRAFTWCFGFPSILQGLSRFREQDPHLYCKYIELKNYDQFVEKRRNRTGDKRRQDLRQGGHHPRKRNKKGYIGRERETRLEGGRRHPIRGTIGDKTPARLTHHPTLRWTP